MPATAGARTDGMACDILWMIMRPAAQFSSARDETLLLIKSLQLHRSSRSLFKAYALVPAAGSGSRLGAAVPKQYLQLAGRPLIYYALQALAGYVQQAGDLGRAAELRQRLEALARQ